MAKERARIVYSGTVQGVGFRFATERTANSIGLVGCVRNCPDGTVEVVCEGERDKIQLFIEKLGEAMSYYISSNMVTWHNATDEFDSFDVRFLGF
ncbi:MAG: acylphosphatase [Candidatus Omnitrophota bacterium]